MSQRLQSFVLDPATNPFNVVEFGMTPQEAAEAANFNSYQLRSSFDRPEFEARTSGPINAIMIDHAQGSFWGGSSNHGEDYGVTW